MHLKLDSLQRLVDQTIGEERAAASLKAEIKRVLGPVVITEGHLVEVVTAANDHMDVLSRTGRLSRLEWQPKVVSAWKDHNHPEVRKFAARVVPEKYLSAMSNDRSPEVRAAVAGRLSLNAIREMIKRFPKDDQLRSVYRTKKLYEAGVSQPGVEPMGHDPVDGKERMGDVERTSDSPGLSEGWYREQARRFMNDYGQNIEYTWEKLAVQRFCLSTKQTSGVEIDEARLLKHIKQLIEEKENMALERNSLRETIEYLEKQRLTEGELPELVEEADHVQQLLHANLTSEQYVQRALQLFKVQEGMLSAGIRKYRLGEGNARQVLIPIIGYLPHRLGFRAVDERALDAFCEAWTRRQAAEGEPLRLEWTGHPTDTNKIGFTCVLK